MVVGKVDGQVPAPWRDLGTRENERRLAGATGQRLAADGQFVPLGGLV